MTLLLDTHTFQLQAKHDAARERLLAMSNGRRATV
jgi:hypothetical protein